MPRFFYISRHATKGGNPGRRQGYINAKNAADAREKLFARATAAGRSKVDLIVRERL